MENPSTKELEDARNQTHHVPTEGELAVTKALEEAGFIVVSHTLIEE